VPREGTVTGQLPVREVARGIVLDNEYWIGSRGSSGFQTEGW
jgi:hypothetical protein